MRISFTFLVVMTGLIGLAPASVNAESVLAIGIPDGDPDNGWVFGFSSGEDAAKQAMRICRGLDKDIEMPANASRAHKDCKIVATFVDKCFAIGSNGSLTKSASGFGWSVEADLETATRLAVAKCRTMAGKSRSDECTRKYKACDGTAK